MSCDASPSTHHQPRRDVTPGISTLLMRCLGIATHAPSKPLSPRKRLFYALGHAGISPPLLRYVACGAEAAPGPTRSGFFCARRSHPRERFFTGRNPASGTSQAKALLCEQRFSDLCPRFTLRWGALPPQIAFAVMLHRVILATAALFITFCESLTHLGDANCVHHLPSCIRDTKVIVWQVTSIFPWRNGFWFWGIQPRRHTHWFSPSPPRPRAPGATSAYMRRDTSSSDQDYSLATTDPRNVHRITALRLRVRYVSR
jgi:hypothetical protein